MNPGEPPPLGGAGRATAADLWAQRREEQEGAAEDSGEQRSLAWERRGAEPGQSRWGEEEGREAVPLRGLDGLDELSPGRPFRKAGERSKGAATMELFPFASAPTADGGGPASGSHAPPSFSLFSLPEMFDASGAPRNTWTSFMTAAAMAPNSGFAAANLAEPVDPCAVVTGHRAPRPLGLAPRGRGAKSGRGSRPPRTAGAAGKGPARRSAGLPRPAQVGGDGSEGLSTPGLASSPSERGSVPYLSEAGDLGAGLSAGVVAGSAFGAASAGCMPSMIDRPSEFASHPEYKKFKHGPPTPFLDDLDIMFKQTAVDGSTSCIPGESEDEEECYEVDDSTTHTPSVPKASGSTATSPKKVGRSPVSRSIDRIGDTLQALKSKNKAETTAEIEEMMALVKDCGVLNGSPEFYVATMLFTKLENRIMFKTIPSETRVGWLKMWAKKEWNL